MKKKYRITYSNKKLGYNERNVEATSMFEALELFSKYFPDVEINSIFAYEVKSNV